MEFDVVLNLLYAGQDKFNKFFSQFCTKLWLFQDSKPNSEPWFIVKFRTDPKLKHPFCTWFYFWSSVVLNVCKTCLSHSVFFNCLESFFCFFVVLHAFWFSRCFKKIYSKLPNKLQQVCIRFCC
jgi:hypothetical protein